MLTSEFNYFLPKKLIAQFPAKTRSSSRLLVLNRLNETMMHEKSFSQIVNHLKPNDLLIFNDSEVLPSRIYGRKYETDGKVEIIALEQIEDNEWKCLVKPSKRLKLGQKILIETVNAETTAIITKELEDGIRIIKFDPGTALKDIGTIPLPPYITKNNNDLKRYQTIYAKYPGSVAAPTAGLHFTNDLMLQVQAIGAKIAFITLHIGLGTFRPVKTDMIFNHTMHNERYTISIETQKLIKNALMNKNRIICVGTTVMRALEASSGQLLNPDIESCTLINDTTNIFIIPGYEFRIANCLITNFHLPKSTLLMLVSAFAKKSFVFKAYEEAINEEYRFYSFGDAMLIV
jgi:S-adenosylmethionine:tRNA ribosyltransferase-isomerase